jgi:PAS domain S-box-containing protein
VKKGAEKKADAVSLRSRAEKQLREKSPKTATAQSDADQKRLIHELRVHQIELEMQNEALRNAQHEIEESQTRYMDLYDFAPVGYLTFDEMGLISELNLAAARFLGMERKYLVNKPFPLFVEPEFRDVFYLHGQEVLRSTAKRTCELVLKRKDGTTFDAQMESIATQAGGSRAIRSVLTDITERKRAEQKLQKSEEWLRQFFSSIPDYCYLVSPEGKIIDANNAVLEALGYTREELIGRPIETIYAPGSQEKKRRLFNQWLKTGVVRNEEMTIRTKGGEERTVLLNTGSMRGRDGRIMHSTSIQTDITERKASEQAVKESEERFRLFFEQNNAGMLLTDPDSGALIDANPAAAKFYGYTREELCAMDIAQIDQSSRDEVLLESGRAVTGNSNYSIRSHLLANNKIRTVELYSTPITVGGRIMLFSVIHDITERKKLEEERIRLEGNLRQAQKLQAIGTLAGGIAHDFNNVLHTIMGFTEMAIESVPKASQEEKHLRYVLQSAHRGKDLVKQILAFSRKTEDLRHPVSLSPLIKETVQFLRSSIPTTIEIILDITATSDTILATSVEVQQVIMNLVTNAALSMQENGGILHISVTDMVFGDDSPVPEADMSPGEYAHLIVTDTGTGMTPNVVNHIFEPFFTTREAGRGTGMGLAVVYGIVKSLDGAITVESKPGIGSTFRVFFPTVRTDVQPEVLPTGQSPRGSEKILFVDDEGPLVELGKAVLEKLGYTVIALTDSTEALNLFSSDPSQFNLIITDQTMPKLTGLGLARKLLKIRKGIPIILCTGYSDSVSPAKAKRAGIREFLMKPFTNEELAEVLRRLLNHKN